MGGGSHVARSMRTSQEGGITRARLFASPPPVMWLIAWTSTASNIARQSRA